jgi:hypothetical protein
MIKDYVEILIIDRHPGRIFSLYGLVSDAFMMLTNDPTKEDIMRNAIRNSMPEDEQTQWIDACSLEGAFIEDNMLATFTMKEPDCERGTCSKTSQT